MREPASSFSEIAQLRRSHRDLGIHFDPVGPLLIRLNEEDVWTGAHLGPAKADIASQNVAAWLSAAA